MLRAVNFLLVVLMLAGAAVVYDFKYEAERATTRVAKINRQIEGERDAIATLKAEWSLLNQPRRLQDLVERYHSYLELDPLDPTQIGTLDDIPFKPAIKGDAPVPTPKGSVKLAQPDKPGEKTAGIGKLLDRLPGGTPDGPATTGSIAKAKSPPPASGPMVLVPKIVVPKPAGDPAKVNR
ncbi:MAG: hypothetical protein OEL76_08095 [Siculibacillus sp.]|nr:hypothetical protein [Siculibacillus sp.]